MAAIFNRILSKPEQEKSVSITENGTTTVTPDSGKTLSKVMITTNVTTTNVTVDTALSSTSTNPVQNKVITAALNEKAEATDLTAHTGNKSNPHSVTKAQVGLENVENVKQYSASNPPPYPVTSVAGKTGAVTLAKGDVELGNVDNTSDANKPVSTAQQQAIDDATSYSISSAGTAADNKITTHNEDSTAHNDIREAVNNAQDTADDAYSLAQGRSMAVVFDTVAAMPIALKAASSTEYRVGDNIFIKATDTPDYWISAVLTTSTGTYGYYEISPLETQKVDLSGYAKTADLTDGTITVKRATNATNDINGNAIDEYYTPLESFNPIAATAENSATAITKIVNGTTTVGKATSATSAESATKATQDGSGNVITTTYATKEELSSLTSGSTVTIAASAWSNKSATVSVNGVTASNNIFVTPSASSYLAYANAQVRCTAQGSGTLTFACETTPTTNISVNVLIFNS